MVFLSILAVMTVAVLWIAGTAYLLIAALDKPYMFIAFLVSLILGLSVVGYMMYMSEQNERDCTINPTTCTETLR